MKLFSYIRKESLCPLALPITVGPCGICDWHNLMCEILSVFQPEAWGVCVRGTCAAKTTTKHGYWKTTF